MSDIEPAVVFHGLLELGNAKWALDSGRTVDFIIPNVEGVNPFKEFQRRRGGKVGQIFGAAFIPEGSELAAYDGEVMLAAWADSSTGQSVRFWLDEEASMHPFAGYRKKTASEHGQYFAAAILLLGETGRPEPVKPRNSKRSQDAHLMVTGERFREYVAEAQDDGQGAFELPSAAQAKMWAKLQAQVDSLSELDIDEAAYARYRDRVLVPYARWNDAL